MIIDHPLRLKRCFVALMLGMTLLCCAAIAAAEPPSTSPSVANLRPGLTPLKPTSYVYVPEGSVRGVPLIVLLHGAGGDARQFIEMFKDDADKRRVVLLSLQSAGRTWPQRAPGKRQPDVDNLDSLLRMLVARPLIDPGQTIILGFSDGASYALSVGLSHPNLFRTIVAFSPGYAFAPVVPDTTQRILIAHGRRDTVLPAANVRHMVKELEKAGYAPRVHWFNGRHEIDPDVLKAALDYALSPQARRSTRTPR